MIRRMAWVATAVLALATGCRGAGGASGNGGGGMEGGFPPTPVEVAAAVTDTVVDAILAVGQIEALESIALQPEVSGRVTEVLVREGAFVRQGQALFRIDDAELKAQVAKAEADRDLAARNRERAESLWAFGGLTDSDLDAVRADARRTRADYDLLAVRLARTTVRAPFTGVAGQRLVSLGDYVTPQTPLLALQTVDPQRAVFPVPERYAERLERGQRVAFRIAALPGREFSGTVDFVDPVVDPASRMILVKARVPNRARELQAGMFLEVRLATETRPDAVVIPEEAVVPSEAGAFVWVVRDGEAERRTVDLGVRSPGLVEIRSGVLAGDRVVVGGQERLRPDAPVSATEVDRTRPAAPAAGPERPPPG